MGTTGAVQQVTITNTGSAPLPITQIFVNPLEFQLQAPPTLPLTLNPGTAATIQLIFTPDAPQSFTGQLTVLGNSSTPPAAVPLNGTGTGFPAQVAPVSLVVHDTPPSGVSILSFEIEIAGASLQASSGSGTVPLTTTAGGIELEHLQTKSGYLGSMGIAPDIYDSLTVTFADPTMSILNDSGATLTAGGTSCAAGQVCQLQPPLNQTSVTVNSNPPFPLSLSASAGITIALDFNISSSVQGDLSISPAVSVSAQNNGQTGVNQNEDELEFFGLVDSIYPSYQSFTLRVGSGSRPATLATSAATQFHFENQNCSAENFTCLDGVGLVRVEAEVNNGTLTADEVDGIAQNVLTFSSEVPPADEALGTIVSVDPAQSQFQLVLHDLEGGDRFPTLALGLPVMVSVQSSSAFDVDAGGLSLSGGLSFSSPANFMAGQEVSISLAGLQTSGSATTLDTNRVTLERSDVSGTVASVDTSQSTLTLTNLPSLFTVQGITQILVETGSFTEFEDVAGLGRLGANQPVSAGGLLLQDPNNANEPILVASAVRVRQD